MLRSWLAWNLKCQTGFNPWGKDQRKSTSGDHKRDLTALLDLKNLVLDRERLKSGLAVQGVAAKPIR